jgi:Flp pilus assembly protein TadB
VRWAVATYAALLERRRPGRLWWLETGVPLAAAVAAVLAFALPWWGQVLAFGAAVAAWYWARPWRAGAMYRARCKAYMPDALAVIACGLKAGHTPAACIQTAAEELPEPLGGAFHWVLQAHRNGATLEDALQLLGRHVPVLDLHQFITLATQSRLSPPDLGEALERLGPGPRE